MGEAVSETDLVRAREEILRLAVRHGCHKLNNALTTLRAAAQSAVAGETVDQKLVKRIPGFVDAVARDVAALHQSAVPSEGIGNPLPAYLLRDEVTALVRLANRNAPVVDAETSEHWGTYFAASFGDARLILYSAALALLESEPRLHLLMRADADGSGGLWLGLGRRNPGGAAPKAERLAIAAAVAKAAGLEIEVPAAAAAFRLRLPPV